VRRRVKPPALPTGSAKEVTANPLCARRLAARRADRRDRRCGDCHSPRNERGELLTFTRRKARFASGSTATKCQTDGSKLLLRISGSPFLAPDSVLHCGLGEALAGECSASVSKSGRIVAYDELLKGTARVLLIGWRDVVSARRPRPAAFRASIRYDVSYCDMVARSNGHDHRKAHRQAFPTRDPRSWHLVRFLGFYGAVLRRSPYCRFLLDLP